MTQGEVTHPLTVLEAELLQQPRVRGQGLDSGIRHLPARAEIEAPQPPEVVGQGHKAGVGDGGAASKLEVL